MPPVMSATRLDMFLSLFFGLPWPILPRGNRPCPWAFAKSGRCNASVQCEKRSKWSKRFSQTAISF